MALYLNTYRIESTRLQEWDYGSPGLYFVTICTKIRRPWFGFVEGETISLSRLGNYVEEALHSISEHHPYAYVDSCIVMPDHVHAIIGLRAKKRGSSDDGRQVRRQRQFGSDAAGSLSVVVGQFKAAVTRWAGRNGIDGFAWQPRFHDSIVRSERHLRFVRRYIRENPKRHARKTRFPT